MAPAAPELPSCELQADAVLAACPELSAASRLWVAFSGGLDSSVLLHLLSSLHQRGTLPMPVHALHIHHGLQPAADGWEQHCQQVCAQLGIPLLTVRVQVDIGSGRSIEEAARHARHAAFAQTLQQGDVLLLAQHQDDQVETVLFRLLRGSGAAGMAGMPRSRASGPGLLLRPLLGYPRTALADYAAVHDLRWIEDASNQQQRYDRNFLRAAIIPPLRQHWPGLNAAIERSAGLSREAAQLQDELAATDLQACLGERANRLQTAMLLELSEIRQRNLLRFWLQGLQASMGIAAVTHQVLHRAVPEVVLAAPDAEPQLLWGQGRGAAQLRRYRGQLYALPTLPEAPGTLTWDGRGPLQLPAPLGHLEVMADSGSFALPKVHLEVRFRRGGERVAMAGRPGRSLKKFLQEAAVPPWLRELMPLVYADGELVAVGDMPINVAALRCEDDQSCRVHWLRSDLDCGY